MRREDVIGEFRGPAGSYWSVQVRTLSQARTAVGYCPQRDDASTMFNGAKMIFICRFVGTCRFLAFLSNATPGPADFGGALMRALPERHGRLPPAVLDY